MDQYYSEAPVALWKKIIGEELHYHFGIQLNNSSSIDEIARNKICDFYKFIKPKSNILDIGCGWGGTMGLLEKELQCSVSGITTSTQQYNYCKNKYNTILCNIEAISLTKKYDYVLFIEVLSHIQNISHLIKVIGKNTNQLILSYQICKQTNYVKTHKFKNMELYDENTIKSLLTDNGWTIVYCEPVMQYAKDSFIIWKQNMEQNNDYQLYEHLRDLYELCTYALSDWDRFLNEYDVINIYCIKK